MTTHIPVVKGPWASFERCCFCRQWTNQWTALNKRKPGEQVACCSDCAVTHEPAQVPTKDAWFDKEMKISAKSRRQHGV